ncbi:MAG: transcriptional repressor [Cytophagales bacterium CG12_big_fil_rev_8_21_14_0_65_40_12]|nr:MAG: transcriptional repressor [Cytophagales bacterium CG12_big_fil_rev_8_21_14_0_65_40_12]PIW05825.1 MAG: transcriptional repressor [Cytophagales bacterium CG17_big_fil_post_rev_8_21_14_2_50_40_13]
MEAHVKTLLKDHDLRLTQGRADVIEVFLNNNIAISHADIESAVDGKYDRVTIYRTLKSFLDRGMIHKILDDKGGIRYALCADECSDGDHQHNHIHFKCNECEQTICLEHVEIPSVKLPRGFTAEESNFLITGICDKCKNGIQKTS